MRFLRFLGQLTIRLREALIAIGALVGVQAIGAYRQDWGMIAGAVVIFAALAAVVLALAVALIRSVRAAWRASGAIEIS